VGSCSCFPYFDTDFNTISLLLYRLHTQCDKTTTHLITKPVIKTKWYFRFTWNKMGCVTNGQVARSFKQHLTWPMHCWLINKFRELFQYPSYESNTLGMSVCLSVCLLVNFSVLM
jgi:hypothetical protein